MPYRNYQALFIFLLITNCATNNFKIDKSNLLLINSFTNKGFALVYNEELYNKKVISKKIDERSLVIFQRYLKKNTQVKITNMINGKSLIAKVGTKSDYPLFNNSVISERISKEIGIDINEPYIKIEAIQQGSLFIAKKAKTYDEEKEVANKVPVNSISINDLNGKKNDNKKITNRNFSYIIKIADFYFKDTSLKMKERIILDTKIKNPKSKKLSDKIYRVYLGPFYDINSLQNSYNDISILEFENIEIIKND